MHLVAHVAFDFRRHFFGGQIQLVFLLRLAHFGHDAFDEGDDLLDFFVGVKDGVQHGFFGHFVGAGFHHHDGFLGAGNGQVKIGFFTLFHRGVQDELAVDQAHLD